MRLACTLLVVLYFAAPSNAVTHLSFGFDDSNCPDSASNSDSIANAGSSGGRILHGYFPSPSPSSSSSFFSPTTTTTTTARATGVVGAGDDVLLYGVGRALANGAEAAAGAAASSSASGDTGSSSPTADGDTSSSSPTADGDTGSSSPTADGDISDAVNRPQLELDSAYLPRDTLSWLKGLSLFSAALSVLGTLFVIVSYFSFGSLQTQPFQLVVMLCCADLMLSVGWLLNVSHDSAADSVCPSSACIVAAILVQYFSVSEMMWVFCIAVNMFLVLKMRVHTDGMLKFYHLLAWGLPAVLVSACISLELFGDAGLWCWITIDSMPPGGYEAADKSTGSGTAGGSRGATASGDGDDGGGRLLRTVVDGMTSRLLQQNSTASDGSAISKDDGGFAYADLDFGVKARLFFYYLPLALTLTSVCFFFFFSLNALPDTTLGMATRKQKLALRLRIYLAVFVVCKTPDILARIQLGESPRNPSVFLLALSAIVSPLQGLGDAVAFGMNRKVLSEWRRKYRQVANADGGAGGLYLPYNPSSRGRGGNGDGGRLLSGISTSSSGSGGGGGGSAGGMSSGGRERRRCRRPRGSMGVSIDQRSLLRQAQAEEEGQLAQMALQQRQQHQHEQPAEVKNPASSQIPRLPPQDDEFRSFDHL